MSALRVISDDRIKIEDEVNNFKCTENYISMNSEQSKYCIQDLLQNVLKFVARPSINNNVSIKVFINYSGCIC